MKEGNGAQGLVWTIHDIKYVTETKGPGFFFSRKTMRFFKDTMKSFSVSNKNGETIVTHKTRGTMWKFNPDNGHMESYHICEYVEKVDGNVKVMECKICGKREGE